jgi:hypothetical protein
VVNNNHVVMANVCFLVTGLDISLATMYKKGCVLSTDGKAIKSLERVLYERIWMLGHGTGEECVFEMLLRTQIVG